MPPKTEPKQNVSALAYAICAVIGLLLGIGLLLFYVYQVPKMVASGVQNQVFYILLLPWALSCAAFLFGSMRSYARFTHKRLGNALELGGPVVFFCLVVAGGFKLVPSVPESFDLTVRAHTLDGPVSSGEISIDFDNTRRKEAIGANGEANFKGLPARFKEATVKVLVNIPPYKEYWRDQKLSGSTLDLPVEATLSGSIVPPPQNWKTLRVIIDGQDDEARVDDLGRFSIPARKLRNGVVRLRIYDGQKLLYDDDQSPADRVTVKLDQ